MFRLLAVLCGCIYLAMMVGGTDHGQLRFGLMPQPEVVRPAIVAAAERATEVAPEPDAQVTNAAFTPSQPVMVTPAVEVASAVETLPDAAPELALSILRINSASANLREGPGTDTPVLDRLSRGEAVQVVEHLADGWVRVRIEGDGGEGYIASRLLSE